MIVLIYEGCGQLSKNKQLLLGSCFETSSQFCQHYVENTYHGFNQNAERLHLLNWNCKNKLYLLLMISEQIVYQSVTLFLPFSEKRKQRLSEKLFIELCNRHFVSSFLRDWKKSNYAFNSKNDLLWQAFFCTL